MKPSAFVPNMSNPPILSAASDPAERLAGSILRDHVKRLASSTAIMTIMALSDALRPGPRLLPPPPLMGPPADALLRVPLAELTPQPRSLSARRKTRPWHSMPTFSTPSGCG